MQPAAPTTPTGIAPEFGLLVHLCHRRRPSPDLVNEALGDLSIPTVIGAASRHGVTGLVVGRLDRLCERRFDLVDAERRLRRRGAIMRELERSVLRALRDRGIEPVVAKGSAIARYYRRPHERGATDLDLLVDRSQLEATLQTLETLGYVGPDDRSVLDGYRRSHFHIPMRRRDGHVVEVHWALVRSVSPFQLEAATVLRSASPDREDADGPAYPTAEHLILILVLQNLQEGFCRLSRIVDLDRVITAGDGIRWDELQRLASVGGLRNSLALSLRLCRILLDTPVPDAIEASIRPPWLTRMHLELERPVESLLTQRTDRTWASRLVFEFWLTDRIAHGLRLWSAERTLDVETGALFGHRVGTATLVKRLPKLPARQLVTYAQGAVRGLRGQRAHTRFWSSHASSSDFL